MYIYVHKRKRWKIEDAPGAIRWVTAAKAAIPLVKQNARSALSSLAKRLKYIEKKNLECEMNKTTRMKKILLDID